MTPTSLRRAMRHEPERGAGTLEYVGILTVVAVLVAAVVIAAINPAFGAAAARAACQIATLGQGDCGGEVQAQERAPEDYIPPEPCVVRGDGAGWDASLAAGIQLEGGQSWLYEELGDNTVRLTRLTDAGVGGEVGAGFDVSLILDDERYGATLSAGAAALLTDRQGDVFIVNSREEAQRVLSAQRMADVKDNTLGNGMLRDGWDGLTEFLGGSVEREQFVPDETFTRTGVHASGELDVTALYGEAAADLSLASYRGRIDRADGTATEVFDVIDVHASADAGTWLTRLENPWGDKGYGEATASTGIAGTVEVDRDASGTPVAMRVRSTTTGHADVYSKTDGSETHPRYTQTTTELPLTTSSQRHRARMVLEALAVPFPDLDVDLSGPNRALRAIQMSDIVRDYAEVAARDGYLYQESFTLDESPYGARFDAKVVLEAGLGATYTTIERDSLEYRYWNGREMVTRQGCAS